MELGSAGECIGSMTPEMSKNTITEEHLLGCLEMILDILRHGLYLLRILAQKILDMILAQIYWSLNFHKITAMTLIQCIRKKGQQEMLRTIRENTAFAAIRTLLNWHEK